jgi:CDGSH-type Zn-finger protein
MGAKLNEARLRPNALLNDMQATPVPNLRRASGEACATVRGVALCRCGTSKNKPFWDGPHWHAGFRDPAKTSRCDALPEMPARARREGYRLGDVLLEVRGLLMCVERLVVRVHFVEHHPRPVFRVRQHVELPSAGFIAGIRRVLERLQARDLLVLGG